MFLKYVLEESVANSILIISFDAKIKVHVWLGHYEMKCFYFLCAEN